MSLKNGYIFLFFIGLFFFSFNSFVGVTFLGEFSRESGIYFFLLGCVVLFLSKKISIPFQSPVFRIILLFLLWCIICTLLNFNGLVTSYLKHTPGINRFLRQYISLILSAFILVIFYYNVLIKLSLEEILTKIRFTFLLSLILAFIVGIFETLVGVFGISAAKMPFIVLNYFPFFEKDYYSDRITSIAYEPPFLAIFLITIAGWMFSYIITHKHKGIKRIFPSLMILFLTYFSGSRTALIVIVLQFLFFLMIVINWQDLIMYVKRTLIIAGVLVVILFAFKGEKIINSVQNKIESLDFLGNLNKNISNKSRLGMQYASIQVFLEHPIIGVGFGQQSYYSRYHYPGWATKKNYEFSLFYKNSSEPSFPPGYNLYTRLLAETGIIGFLIFLLLIVMSLRNIRKIIKNNEGDAKILAIIIFITLTGLYINWFQIDTFRIYGVWISLALLMRMDKNKKNESQSNSIINTAL